MLFRRACAFSFLLAVAVAVPSLPAFADDRADRALAREHYLKGTKAFDLGLYDDAIKEYVAAYQAKDDPALLYNIAQAHRQAGHAQDALRFYQRYLAKVPTTGHRREEIEVKIAELQKLIEQQKRTESLPPNQPIPTTTAGDAPSTDTSPATAASEAPRVAEAATAPSAPAVDLNAGRTKKIAGLVVGGVGVAALVSGVAFCVLAKNASNDIANLDRMMGTYDPAKYQAGQLDQTLGAVFLGVGGAAVVAGVVVYALGHRQAQAARRLKVSFAPLYSPGSAGASAQFRF
jgi:tetratricopeptide (TPR) repeat protein